MISQDSLPVILVSAVDRQTAENFISDVTAESESRVLEEGGCVWSIQNKYYSADVRMLPFADGEPVVCDPFRVEAHLIYLTADECADTVAWRRRAAAAAGAATDAAVRVCACAGDPPALPPPPAALRDYEPVRLRGGGDGGDGDGDGGEGDEGTLVRVREALHAHTWRGLRRREAGGGGGGGARAGGGAGREGWAAAGLERWAGVVEAASAAARLSPASRRRRADALLPALYDALCDALNDDDEP